MSCGTSNLKLQTLKNLHKDQLSGELGGDELENKISIFTDGTQLFNKYERYVEKPVNKYFQNMKWHPIKN